MHLRRVAEIFVDIREQIDDPTGRGPDWTGKSQEYRDAVSAAYREVEGDVAPDRLRQMKSVIRYHISTVVRDRIDDPEVLSLYGLQSKSIRDRTREAMTQHRAMISALVSAGVLDQATHSSSAAARLVDGARYLLELAAEAGLEDADQKARQDIIKAFERVAESAGALTPATTRVALARDYLNGVLEESGALVGFTGTVRDALIETLDEMTATAAHLRRDLDGTQAVVEDLFSHAEIRENPA